MCANSRHIVGMVKQPTAEQSEFQMSSEDFPALPGTQISGDGSMVMTGLGGLMGDQSGQGGGGGGDKHVGGGVTNMSQVGGGGVGVGVTGGIGGQVGGQIGGGGDGGSGGVGSIGDMGRGGGMMGGGNGGVIGSGATSGVGGIGVGSMGAGMDMQPDSMTAAQNDKAFQRGVQTSPDGMCCICSCLFISRATRKAAKSYKPFLDLKPSVIPFRQSHKHPRQHGQQPVRHGRPADVHPGIGDRQQSGDAGNGPRSDRPRVEPELAGQSVPDVRRPVHGSAVSVSAPFVRLLLRC